MIKGSSRFQVMVFKPNANHFRAANFLCICAQCRIEYGTCSNFLSYELRTGVLKKIDLRSEEETPTQREEGSTERENFILPGTYCAIAADRASVDPMWFVKVKGASIAKETITDDYSNTIVAGLEYITGQFL